MKPRFRSMAAQAHDWRTAAMICAEAVAPVDHAALGLVYVTEAVATHLPEVVSLLSATTGVRHWAGTIGAGVCGTNEEFFSGAAVSILILPLEEDDWTFLPSLRQPEDVADAIPEDWMQTARPLVGLVHGDPRNEAIPGIIELLPEAIDSYLVGGLTVLPDSLSHLGTKGLGSVGGHIAGTLVPDHHGEQPGFETITGGGLSGVLFGANVPVVVGLSQGCQPIGPPHLITSMDDDWVEGLNNRTALDVLRQDLQAATLLSKNPRQQDDDGLASLAGTIHAAVPVSGSDTADYLVRSLMAIDIQDGRLGIAADLVEGERLMFVRRDPVSAEADLRAMVRRLLARCPEPPRGALYISCLARGPRLFGQDQQEMAIITEELGTVPLTGFFAGGEINHNRIYTFTGVLMLFL